MNIQKYAFKGSPFLPIFDREKVVDSSIADIKRNFEHAAAIALSVSSLMTPITQKISIDLTLLTEFGTTNSDLNYLTYGYQYPIETILASAVCKKVIKNQRSSQYEQIIHQSHDFQTLRMQDQVFMDLNATINLLNIDPSGALVFQFNKDYPFSKHEYFKLGMEIATITFFGISIEVAEKLGNDDWLNVPFDPTMLG